MDMNYFFKKLMGTLTFEDEQAYRAKQAGLRDAQVSPPPQTPTVGDPTQVQPVQENRFAPGGALRSRQDVMDDAMRELERQNKPATMRSINSAPAPAGPRSDVDLYRSNTFMGVRG
jgi:hypothetical protein